MNSLLDSAVEKITFLSGGGEMGALMRSKDWGSDILGETAHWPQSLRTTISILLHSKFPMFLWWGPELICFYNDAYRPSLGKTGKHPSILGQRGEEAWPEVWSFIKPLIDQVLRGGDSVWMEDQLVPIERNGRIEDVYWTFSYSPVYVESGMINGVLVVCTETTGQVHTRKVAEEAERLYRDLVRTLPVAVYTVDRQGKIDLHNEAAVALWGRVPETEKDRWNGTIGVCTLEGAPIPVESLPIFQAVHEDRSIIAEIYLRRPDGGLRHVITHPKPMHDNTGKVTGAMNVLIDITDRKLAEEALHVSEEKFRSLAQIMPQLIWTTDAVGILNYISPSVLTYTGLITDRFNSDGWLPVIHPDDRKGYIEKWDHSLQTGEPFLLEHRHCRHDGVYRWHLTRAIPQRDADGKIQMWVVTGTDIDEIKQHEQQKDDFIKIASHELKTPITTIKGYVQLLLRELTPGSDPFLQQSLSTIDKQVSRLTKLVGDLLDVTKIDMGSFHLNKRMIRIGDVVRDTIREIQATTPAHTLHFQQHADPVANIDKDRIQQVLVNLFTNAIKYSPHGGEVLVTLDLQEGNLILSVRDFGIGIAREDHDKIFNRFYRVSGKDEKTFPGFGIGLFIVGEIIAQHGGKVWVDSEKGQGSVFHISLPVQ